MKVDEKVDLKSAYHKKKTLKFFDYESCRILTRLTSYLLDLLRSFHNVHVCAVLNHPVMSDSVTPWTAAHQALQVMEFSRQEY